MKPARRASADRTLRLLSGGRGFDELLTPAERALDKLDPAFCEVAASLRAATDPGAPRIVPYGGVNARCVLDDVQRLDVYRARFERGDAEAILGAIVYAIQHSLPVPAWAGAAFVERMERFHSAQPTSAPSLDELFGVSGTPLRRAKRARDMRRGALLWASVTRRLATGQAPSLDAALRAELRSGRWGFGLTRARELVELVERHQRPFLQTSSPFKRRLVPYSGNQPKTRKR